MKATIAIVGALDTKGTEFTFLKSLIEKQGCRTVVIDVGVLGAPQFAPDISSSEVAQAGGADLAALRTRRDRGEALDAMSRGLPVIAKRLFAEKKLDGIISMGGSGGTGMAVSAMRALPVGVPKVMVSTVASGDTSGYVGTTDIIMVPSIVDIAGLNRLSRSIISNAAAAICGMVTGRIASRDAVSGDKPMIAASMFGNTTRCVDAARSILESKGYEVLVFHATGVGGRTMEMLIAEGYFEGVLDITTTEWADEVCGGVLSAGPERLDAAVKAGVPQVITPGCIDMCNFRGPETVPQRYEGRKFNHWSANVTLMRTTPEENARMGRIFAEKLNASRAPVAVFIPRKGFSELDAPGKPFWWPEADQAFVKAFASAIRSDMPVCEMDVNINDPEFSERVAHSLLEMLH